MLLALYAGRLSDRMGARPPTIFGSAGVAAGLVVPFIMPSLAGLYISAMLIGTGYVFLNVSIQNLIGVVSESGERTKNFSNYSLVLATGGFLGPLAAGFGIDALGYTRAYLCLAAAPLLALALALASGRQAAVAAGAAHEAQEAQAKKAVDLWRIPGLKRVFVTSAMVLTGIDLYQFYLPIYGHSIGLSASLIGVVLSTFAAAAFVVRSAVPLLTRLAGEDALLRYALYVGALAYLFMPFLANPWLLALMSFVLGLGLGAGQPLSMMLTYARSPAGRSGEALGLRMSVNNFTHVAVPLAFGTLGAAFGVVAGVFRQCSAARGRRDLRPDAKPGMNLHQIIAITMFAVIGFKGVRVLSTLYAVELGASPFGIGVLIAAFALFPLVLAVHAGRVADRYGVRMPLLLGTLGMAAGVLLPFFLPRLAAVYAGAALTGAAFIFVQVSTHSLTAALGEGVERTRNFSIFALAMSVTDFIGPVLAGSAIDRLGYVEGLPLPGCIECRRRVRGALFFPAHAAHETRRGQRPAPARHGSSRQSGPAPDFSGERHRDDGHRSVPDLPAALRAFAGFVRHGDRAHHGCMRRGQFCGAGDAADARPALFRRKRDAVFAGSRRGRVFADSAVFSRFAPGRGVVRPWPGARAGPAADARHHFESFPARAVRRDARHAARRHAPHP